MKAIPLLLVGAFLVLSFAPASAQYLWCWETDRVYALVYGSTIVIHHDATVYNCCPDSFVYEIAQVGDTFEVDEIEVLTMPCACLCCFDLSTSIEGVAPGEHVIIFGWNDYETSQWQERVLHVTVPDVGQKGPVGPGASYSSGCIYEPTSAEEPMPENDKWGSIKALFR